MGNETKQMEETPLYLARFLNNLWLLPFPNAITIPIWGWFSLGV
jgi:hypothetical protein